MRRFATILLTLLLATSCIADASSLDTIDWWKGDIEKAFAAAKEQDKPLFLYWGAVWCPPCNQIKKTIFTRREFQEKMKLFLPVYLDGDTDRAQIWGERLKAKGYPTMLVLNPQGQEVMRLPTGLQVEDFNAVLDQALQTMKPVKEILDEALAAKRKDVPDAAYRLLAYYSWGQDSHVNLSPEAAEGSFRKLQEKCPERLPIERSRLLTLWLQSAIELADEKDSGFSLTAEERAAADHRVREILGNHGLVIANMEFVLYGAGDIVGALHPEQSPERTRLIEAWEQTADWIEGNEALSVDERTSALIPSLELHKMERGDKELPAKFRKRVLARTKWADKMARDAYTRQSAMSTAGWLLRQVGLDDEARALYTTQLEKAVSPHYFMSSLATLAKKDGDIDQAVSWMRKAYEASEGRATRFQWGTSYLLGLMDLVPGKADTIQSESQRVFKELLALDDSFAGRNHRRIQRLARGYTEWNEKHEHQAELESIRKAMRPQCDQLSTAADDAESSLKDRCIEFFEHLGNGKKS